MYGLATKELPFSNQWVLHALVCVLQFGLHVVCICWSNYYTRIAKKVLLYSVALEWLRLFKSCLRCVLLVQQLEQRQAAATARCRLLLWAGCWVHRKHGVGAVGSSREGQRSRVAL